MSQTFPPIVATLPNPTGPYCQKREIGPTLIIMTLVNQNKAREEAQFELFKALIMKQINN